MVEGEDDEGDESDDISAALVARLAADAVLVDEGRFTLDIAHAREKLAAHQLDDPQRFVLLLVEAGHLLPGCCEIAFFLAPTHTHVRFEGARLEPEQLRTLFDALFVDPETLAPEHRRVELARQRLALAINTALAQPHAQLWLRAELEHTRVELGFVGDAPPQLTSREGDGSAPALVFGLRGPTKRGSGAGVLELAELRARLLRAHCHFASVPVTLDGERINRPGFGRPDLARFIEILDARGHGVGVAGWSAARHERPATLCFVCNGVVCETLVRDDWRPGFTAIIEASDLRRDLSLTKLTQDEAFDARVTCVRRAHDALIDEAIPQRWSGAGHTTRVNSSIGVLAISSMALLACVTAILSGLDALPLLLAGVVPSLALVGVGVHQLLSARRTQRLRATGHAGVGVIVSRHTTIKRVGELPEFELQLEIRVPGRTPYEAALKVLEDPESAPLLERGKQLFVRVDPEQPERVALDSGVARKVSEDRPIRRRTVRDDEQ